MGMDHTAFGLALRSSFPLPGLAARRDASLPRLDLKLRSPEQLRRTWSGSASPSAWRGMLGDGTQLSIEWGREGDLLFVYGEEAWFLLDRRGAEMTCAAADVESPAWQRVLLSRVLPMVAVARGYEALHAAAVETPAGVVALAGSSGAGKSTLAAELLRRGHRLVADDVLVLGSAAGRVLAHPAGPHLSLEAGRSQDLGMEVLGELGGKSWAALGEAASGPGPVVAVAILARGGGAAPHAEEVAASPLTLAPFMLGLPDESGRDGRRFSLYADLVEDATILELAGAAKAPTWAFAEALERAVGLPAMTANCAVR
jgi:HPr Serine kinase C-terminal domain